jgi:hypothetical protein
MRTAVSAPPRYDLFWMHYVFLAKLPPSPR